MWLLADRLPLPRAIFPSRTPTKQNLSHTRRNLTLLPGSFQNTAPRRNAPIMPPPLRPTKNPSRHHLPSAVLRPRKENPQLLNVSRYTHPTEVRVAEAMLPWAEVADTGKNPSAKSLITGTDRWRLRAMLSLPAGRFNYHLGTLLPSLRLPLPPASTPTLPPCRYYPSCCGIFTLQHVPSIQSITFPRTNP